MKEFFRKLQDMDIVTKMSIVGALVVLFILLTIVIVSCNGSGEVVDDFTSLEDESVVEDEDVVDETPKDYARVIAVISGIDINNGLINIINVESNDKVVVKIADSMEIYDAFGSLIALNQLYIGDLVEAKYDKATMEVAELKISNQGWEHESSGNMMIDQENMTISIFNDTYYYNENLILYFGEDQITLDEIDPVDELVIRGYINTVWSISLQNKHGYVVLEGADSFIGGTLEIAQNYVTITDATRVAIPVGVHDVIITKDGMDPYVTQAMVEEGLDFIIDLSGIQALQGAVQFTIVQEETTLYVDDERISDLSQPINFDYGNHEVLVEKEGYLPWTTTLYVNEPYQEFAIDLDVQPLMVKVDEPMETELYIDDILIGTIPIQAPISRGTHVIRLEKDGYFPKTQNIVIDIESGVYEINFPELTPDPNYVGTIEISVQHPEGCDLFIGAELIGTIPLTTSVDAGDHQLTIRKDGFTAKIYNISVMEDGGPYEYAFPDLLPLDYEGPDPEVGDDEPVDDGDEFNDDTDETDTPVDDNYVEN